MLKSFTVFKKQQTNESAFLKRRDSAGEEVVLRIFKKERLRPGKGGETSLHSNKSLKTTSGRMHNRATKPRVRGRVPRKGGDRLIHLGIWGG